MAGSRAGGGALRSVILIVATLTTGLCAGVFTDWSNTVMPGLKTLDDRTFVLAFKGLDAAILNPLFLGVELTGALVLIAVSVGLHLPARWRPVLPWVSAALLCFVVVLVITFAVHEPLNQNIRMAGALRSGPEFASARAELDEARWTVWNNLRALVSTLTFALLCWALVVHGRVTGGSAAAVREGAGPPRYR